MRRGGGGGKTESGFQVTGMIEWVQKIKAPPKILRASNKPPKISGPKINPQKTHAEFFQALKISRKQTEVWL